MLTVFIATHGRAATLERVLDAYTELTDPAGGWKLVVIDNAGDAESRRVLSSFGDRLPLVTISEPRRGKNRALNSGLRELEGDLAVFSDDDCLPDPDWLVRLRLAADSHSDYAIFGGAILAHWSREPDEWIRQWVQLGPVYAVTDDGWDDGPCEPTRVWGPNMAIRAEPFMKGYRFDENIGPDGSATYAMGGETELTLRLTIAEGVRCWHCKDARVRHIVTPRMMTKRWVLRRAFGLGRASHRESRQRAVPGAARWDKIKYVCRHAARLVLSRRTVRNKLFAACWQLNLGIGRLYEAIRRRPDKVITDHVPTPSITADDRRSRPSVSVVLPTYNRAGLVGRAIRSVLDQTYRDLELIIVDDGSNDATTQVVGSFDDPRVRLIRYDRNRGAGAARNIGIRASSAPIIAFQDSDDEWVPSKLERHMRVFEAFGPETGVVYSDMERIKQNGTTEYHRSPDIVPGVLIDPSTGFYQVCNIGIQAAVIRRECFVTVGLFNEALPALEDLELFIRLSASYSFHHLTAPFVRYHETPGGLSSNMTAQRGARKQLLRLYGSELRRENKAFVRRESVILAARANGRWRRWRLA